MNTYFSLRLSGLLLLTALLAGACHSAKSTRVDYTQPDATRDKKIRWQSKRTYTFEGSGVAVSNQFAGARLNDFRRENDSTFTALIKPENAPINNSAWYAFKIWGPQPKAVTVNLVYQDGSHRYHPKISRDGRGWQALPAAAYQADTAQHVAQMRLDIGPDTLWVAGQEIFGARDFQRELAPFLALPFVRQRAIGESKQGRAIFKMDIGEEKEPRRLVAIISRQHPPEVTGTYALLGFLRTICGESDLARQFRREFGVVAIPLMNPDGVAEGHWRHNTGGIDLNRDWLYFNQPETRVARDEFLKIKADPAQQLFMFLDFHSTQRDIFYTMKPELETVPPHFSEQWLAEIQRRLPDYQVRERASGTKSPVSKSWFYLTFGVPSVTFEIGDDTPRESVDRLARVAAEVMMEQLLDYVAGSE
ncbi:MAG TPA: M14 family metallopeptidase [Calditrichia bacterium]|nr:M14 family metallopeptidase [Calditrichia bacterium]